MFWVIFIENIENRVFQNGDSIILFHGALVKSNFDGLKPQTPRAHDFWDYWKCHRPLGALMFDFGSADLS